MRVARSIERECGSDEWKEWRKERQSLVFIPTLSIFVHDSELEKCDTEKRIEEKYNCIEIGAAIYVHLIDSFLFALHLHFVMNQQGKQIKIYIQNKIGTLPNGTSAERKLFRGIFNGCNIHWITITHYVRSRFFLLMSICSKQG